MAFVTEPVVKHVHGSFEASPDAPGRARWLVLDALDRWGVEEGQARDSIVLLTSELVTNAIRHCRRRVELHVHLEGDRLRIEVLDDSPLGPTASDADLLSEKGRGLQIVEMLAAAWGVEPLDAGKKVWFEVEPVVVHA
jgi:anti-sigma regulatory factor (Ser/Thr protein kinase)